MDVCDLFLEQGVIVSTKGRNHKDESFEAKAEGTLLLPADKHPMAVLVNRYRARASEIVSACLQHHGRAIVVGERCCCRCSVQNIIKMENGASVLKLTTASYWRPSGRNIHHFPDAKDFEAAGIDPDEWGVLPSGYKLTPAAIDDIRKAGVPDEVLAKLKGFPEKSFLQDSDYLAELGKFLTADEMNKYRAKFIYHADREFKVAADRRGAGGVHELSRGARRGPRRDERRQKGRQEAAVRGRRFAEGGRLSEGRDREGRRRPRRRRRRTRRLRGRQTTEHTEHTEKEILCLLSVGSVCSVVLRSRDPRIDHPLRGQPLSGRGEAGAAF